MSSDTHYIEFDPDELWAEMIEAYETAGGDTLYPGDEKEILLRAVQAIALSILAKCDSALMMDTLKNAVREYLDYYGEKRNCERITAKSATATARIQFMASGIEQTIPAGTELTADGVVLYKLTEDVEQTGQAQTVDVPIECSESGTAGNALAQNAQMQFLDGNEAVISVTAITAASGGEEEEDDETYRERIREYGLTTVTTGPSSRYEAAAKEVSSRGR